MAMAEPVSSTLRLVLYEGEDEETGNPIYKSKSFNNVKVSANADQLFIVAEAFTQLQELPLYSIERRDNSEIVETEEEEEEGEGEEA